MLLGLAGSAAIGSLATLYFARTPAPVLTGAPDEHADALRAARESLSELAQRVAALERAQLAAPLAPAPSAEPERASVAASQREVVEPTPDEGRAPRTIPANWTEVLDARISRALVERALTPFDPGVAEHVRAAGAALRKSNAEHAAENQRLQDLLHSGGIAGEDFNSAIRRSNEIAKASSDDVIRRLEAQLDALAR